MKRNILVLLFAVFSVHSMIAQNMFADSVASKYSVPIYKLYPTENVWTFLELETTTGKIWQIQYSFESEKRLKLPLNSFNFASFSSQDNEEFAGRFELVKTQNMYNFLLLDTLSGRIWQIQWSMDADKRGVLGRITNSQGRKQSFSLSPY